MPKSGGIRLSYEHVRDYFRSQGCELLEDHYKNARTKMKYRCSCGNESEIVLYSFQNGNRCRECGNKKISEHFKKHTTESLKAHYAQQGCELMDEYVHAREPMKYRCKCGTIAQMSWNNFQRGKRCWQCSLEKRRRSKRTEKVRHHGRKGEQHHQWRSDKERQFVEYRYRQSAYRMAKALGRTDIDGRLAQIEDNFGYTIDQFSDHLASFSQFAQSSWELDHVFPVWAFLEVGVTDPKVIHSLENLQVIALEDHQKKAYKFNPIAFVKFLKKKGIPVEV